MVGWFTPSGGRCGWSAREAFPCATAHSHVTKAAVFGTQLVVNGKVSPRLTVDRGKYRLRILNACEARALRLTLQLADANSCSLDSTHRSPPASAAPALTDCCLQF